jgi:tubulin-specific chaperone A
MFKDNVEVASEVQKEFANIHNEATKSIAKQKSELDLLTKVAQDNSVAQEKRVEAIKKLNQIIPDHIGILTLENIKNQEGLNILKAYTDEIYKNARARAVKRSYDKLVEEQVSVEGKSLGSYRSGTGEFFKGKVNPNLKSDDDIKNWANEFTKELKDKDGNLMQEGTAIFYKFRDLHYNNMKAKLSGLLDDKNQELSIINAKIKALEPEVTKNTIKDLGNKDGSVISNYNPIGGTNKVGNGKGGSAKKNDNSYINDELKLTEELYNIRKKAEEVRISMMADGYEKDLALEKLNGAAKIQELTYQNTSFQKLQTKLNDDLLAAQKVGDTKKIASIKNQQALLTEKQKANNELICYEEEMQNKRIGIITEKAAKESITKSKEAFDQAKILRETKFNEEYVALGNNKRAKEKLKNEFEANELEQETIFLNELIAKFNTIVGKGKIDGIDLTLLSPEQVASFTAEAAKVGLSLSELIKKKNELAGKTSGSDFGILQGQGTDIFGFSPEQWSSAFNNFDTMEEKIGAVSTVLGGLQNAFSMYSSFVEANSKRDLQNLDKKQTAERIKLKNQLDRKQITQAQYDKKVAKLDADKEKAQANADYKRAKNEKIAALFSIAVNTGIGVMKAVAASPLTGGLPWSAIIGGLGLLQAGMVLAQPLPAKGYEAGLYQDYVTREQDGKRFKSSYQGKTRSGLVSKTSHFLVAENGPEMVIDAKAWRQMNPEVKDSLIRELRGVKGFEQGLYNQAVQRYEVPASSAPTPSGNDQMMNQMMMSIMAENLAVLKEIKQSGIIAIVTNKDMPSMKNLKEGIEDYNNLRTKSKK